MSYGIALTITLTVTLLATTALIVNKINKNKINKNKTDKINKTAPRHVNTPEPIIIRNEIMNAAFPDRSAGRECTICNQYGSHHTDQHNKFATEALRRATISYVK